MAKPGFIKARECTLIKSGFLFVKKGGDKMEIVKILNNNVIVTLNNQGVEQIVTGRGIAFKKKIGETIDNDRVTQVFKLTTDNPHTKVLDLVEQIPIEIIEVVDQIIKMAELELNKELNDSVYFFLMDHLNSAIEREKKGIFIKNILQWDIKRFFTKEYEIGKKGLDMVNKELNIQLSEEEAGFIALHIVNSEMADDSKDMTELTELMSSITSIITYHFKQEIDVNTIFYDRFITHLKYFCYRVLNQETYIEKPDEELFNLLQRKYHNENVCVDKISEFLYVSYEYQLTDQERFYLTIHIAKLVKNNT